MSQSTGWVGRPSLPSTFQRNRHRVLHKALVKGATLPRYIWPPWPPGRQPRSKTIGYPAVLRVVQKGIHAPPTTAMSTACDTKAVGRVGLWVLLVARFVWGSILLLSTQQPLAASRALRPRCTFPIACYGCFAPLTRGPTPEYARAAVRGWLRATSVRLGSMRRTLGTPASPTG